MSRFASLLLMMIFSLLISEGSGQARARNVTDAKCPPRNKNLAGMTGHVCQKSCERRTCSKNRPCTCDGLCGLSCISPALSCLWPVKIQNAETRRAQESNLFGDSMQVMCKPGFRMANGLDTAMSRCQGDGNWSFTAPCEDYIQSLSVCKPPQKIENGFHEDGPFTIGREVRYWCDYGYRLVGISSLVCQENKEWSHPVPHCHPINCSRPPNVAQATLVAVHRSEYPVRTVIYYLCKKDFYLDGSNRVVCLENGSWSQLPFCRARCPISAQRSRVIYHGRKLWINEIPGGLVHHGEVVKFFCRSQNKTCSFEAESRCFDGVLALPGCYDEPTYLQYHFFPKRVVSEMPACWTP